MTSHRKPGTGLTCLVLLIMIATITIAGCTDSSQDQQSQVTPPGTQQIEKTTMHTTATTKTVTVAAPRKTAQPVSTPVSSTGVIKIDPISDKNTGDTFTLTGTTSLPEGTNIFWQILPDTGTPPTGLDGDSMMSVGGNYLVSKGDGSLNRISLSVDLGRLVPGKYVAIVGKMKGDQTTGVVFEIGNDYGYTYFTLKQAGEKR
ncbi:MAG: hypothetical protein PHT99_07710 [Methanoregula sp.]|nr:hypothetical protein [Methanoregula sp.]